jgi:Hypothetical glycosyl hydrolase family 15
LSYATQLARTCAAIAALSALMLLGCAARALAAAPAPDPAGVVHFAKSADSSMDAFTYAPSLGQQAWMRDHYWRMRVYSPYFDSRTGWYGKGWFYKDSYAIYVGEALATQHPDWILRDSHGNKVFIQFGCGGGSCPQYAADIGNPDFRAHWIADAKASLAQGYKGIFIDDVNMEMRVSDGYGNSVAPTDPRTGRPMTQAAWRHYMADFMVEVRGALPNAEIVHNALWFDGDSDPDVARELRAADFIEIERGVNDSGLTGGHGQFGLETWMDFIDHRHADGHGVVLDANATTQDGRLYGLAAYFLISSGRDAMSNAQAGTPADWWAAGYGLDLGAALGPRYQTADGVWRRDFSGGTVLLNEPGAPTRTVSVPAGLHDLDGVARSSVTLGPASGAVLVGAVATTPATTTTTVTTAPVATPKPVARPKPVATPTKPQRAKRTRARVSASAARHRVRISGRVRGARAGRVEIVVQQHSGRRWARARRLTARIAAGGRFARTITARPGRYRVQARFSGDGTAQPSRSPFRRFTAWP